MNLIHMNSPLNIYIFLLAILTLPSNLTQAQKIEHDDNTISLAGKWNIKLDPNDLGVKEEWYNQKLSENIDLPGSCEEYGYGTKTTEPAVGKLTRVYTFEGKAWYQKEIDIPEGWNGKRTELFLERCHWESNVWIDGKSSGTQNSLSAPHIYDLGNMTPGKHLLSICVDNSYKLPIGLWAHAITEQTQTNWNGIIGKIKMRASDPVWIKSVQVYASHLQIDVGNQSGAAAEVEIESKKFKIPEGGKVVEVPFSTNEENWDEFAPVVREMTVSLTSDKWKNSKIVRYGLRKIAINDKQFVVNGRPIMMRGTVDECVYPLTGYPPMDKNEWLRIIGVCQSYGFNFMRFHSWCPPRAAFEAGDELGFLFQIELPLWTAGAPHFGEHPLREQFMRDELNLILETYGNHPSFAFMAMGNESAGTLDELTKIGRAKDSRHLYRCEVGNTEETGDFYEIGQRGFIGPRTDWDRWSFTPGWIVGTENANLNTGASVPTFAHEVGQWAMYPNLKDIVKYTGPLKAYFFNAHKESLKAHHMIDQAEDFARASGMFSVLLYKDEIEASLRTYPYGGLQIMDARDYPGHGTSIIGWLDAFWDSKGLITPEEFRRFCAPTVCLLRMPKRVLFTNELFTAKAEIAHYGAKDMAVSPEWKIEDEHGNVFAMEKLADKILKTGRTSPLGDIQVDLSSILRAQKLTLTLSAAGTSNSWEIWVYPDQVIQKPDSIRIAYSFDDSVIEALKNGDRVLLFSSPKEGLIFHHRGMMLPDSLRYLPDAKRGQNAIPGSFAPVFWSTRLFNQIGTIGILCNPGHPLFSGFPTEEYSNWQWADLLGHFTAAESFRVAGAPSEVADDLERAASDVFDRSKAIMLDGTPASFKPLLQVIDNYDRNEKLGTIFEANVGAGKLLVCAMDLETEADKRPAAKQLMKSLLNYAGGNLFHPEHELSIEYLDQILSFE